jgi:hypothetical protein
VLTCPMSPNLGEPGEGNTGLMPTPGSASRAYLWPFLHSEHGPPVRIAQCEQPGHSPRDMTGTYRPVTVASR